MMRVAYLSLQAAQEGQASYAHVWEIVSGLRRLGLRVDVFSPEYRNTVSRPGVLSRLLEEVRCQIRLWRSGRPSIVYIRWHFASWPTALAARLLGVPTVQEVNGTYEDLFLAWPLSKYMGWLLVRLLRSQLRWASAVIAVTRQLAEWVCTEIGDGREKVHVIPNGVNTELFRPLAAREEIAVELRERYVIFVGALAPWQGISVMLTAVEHPSWPEELKLVIVGDGVEREKVEAAAASVRVRYLGFQPYRVIPNLLARSVAALSPQVGRRGATGLFPLKVLEALACGVPVVVTDFPGMADLVRRGGCGVVVPEGDPGSLAEAVARLFASAEEAGRMGARGRELVAREHSWQKRAEETYRVLSEVLGSATREPRDSGERGAE